MEAVHERFSAATRTLRSGRALRGIPALHPLALAETRDVCLAKGAINALAKIGGMEALDILRLARSRHPVRFVRQTAAAELCQSTSSP
jgi:hypothetical protein